MNVYVVFKDGVYRHEIVGLYESLEKAIDGAKYAVSLEKDSYHTFEIGYSELDKTVDDVEVIASVSIEFFSIDFNHRPIAEIATTKKIHDKPLIKVKFYE